MKALGARLVPVPYADANAAMEAQSYAGMNGTFVHPSTTTSRMRKKRFPDAAAIFFSTAVRSGGGGSMRGTDRQTRKLFSYASPDSLVPRDHPLRAIRLLVNAALDRLSADFAAI